MTDYRFLLRLCTQILCYHKPESYRIIKSGNRAKNHKESLAENEAEEYLLLLPIWALE